MFQIQLAQITIIAIIVGRGRHCFLTRRKAVSVFLRQSTNIMHKIIAKQTQRIMERGLVYNACNTSPFKSSRTALTPPHPGHGMPVNL